MRPNLPALLLMTLALTAATSAPPAGAQRIPHPSLVIQNYYYALAGKADEVYQWRLHASDVRASLGLRRGRVLRPLADQAAPNAANDQPDVIWECEYPDTAAREAESSALENNPAWRAVEAHMDTLIRKFRRARFAATP